MPKHIVITGVSKGIGRALALEFHKQGHIVSGCARNKEQIDSLRDEIMGHRFFCDLDINDNSALIRWADAAIQRFGAPDILINNAAIINRNASFIDLKKEEFDKVIDINIKGVANVMRAFMPSMIKKEAGIIINMSSGWGRSVSAEVSPYCASKWAIEGLTQSIAQELPVGMAAIPLSPNMVNTEMLKSCIGIQVAQQSPGPEEWAKTTVPWILGLGTIDNGIPLSTPR